MSRHTNENRKKARKVATLERIEKRFLVFSEGEETEPHYFKGFKRAIESNPIYKNSVQLIPIGTGRETINVVKEAEKYIQKHGITFAEVWCLYDKDDFPADQFNSASRYVIELNAKYASTQVNFHAAWSNECIEYWFVLHFSNYTSNNHRAQYEEFLDRVFRQHGLGAYKKNDPEIWDKLLDKGNPKNAITFSDRQLRSFSNCQDSECAPATRVHELVKELRVYLPPNIRSQF